MTPETEKRVLSTIYDAIANAITYSPSASEPPVTDKRTTLLQLARNYAVNPADFANAFAPANLGGDLGRAENFSRFIDALPEVQNSYVPKAGKSVDATYGDIVRGANSTEVADPAQEQRYREAYKFLYKKIVTSDETPTLVESDVYYIYNTKKQAYFDALTNYRTAYIGLDHTKPTDQQRWQAMEPALRNKLKTAYNSWRAAQADKVESAIAIMGSSINSMVRAVLQRCKEDYENSKRGSVLGDATNWHLSYAIPGNWHSAQLAPSLSDLTISSDRLNSSASSEFSSWGGGASWNAGLWSIGGGASGSSSDERRHMDSEHFKLRFKFGVVQVRRPWFDMSLFQMNGWSLGAAVSKGGISEGKLLGAENKLMPLVVTSYVIARNIEVEANWSTEDYHHVSKSVSGGARVGWGPFQFSGSYHHSSSSTTFNSTYDGGVLKVPGIQVVAFVSSIVPSSPPQ